MAWFIVGMSILVVIECFYFWFLRVLREEHPKLYIELGSPTLFPKDPFRVEINWRFFRFMLLPDVFDQLNALGEREFADLVEK